MAVLRTQQTAAGRKMQAIVRKGGFSLSRVFWRKGDAQDWARRVEDAIASATPTMPFDRKAWLPLSADEAWDASFDDSRPHGGWTLDRALDHYARHVTPTKKGASQELRRIGQWRERPLAKKRFDQVTREDVQAHVTARMAEGRSGSTVRHEVMLLRALYRDAAKAWKVAGLQNPCAGVDLPSPAPHRERRLQDGHGDTAGEEERLRLALAARNRGEELIDMLDLSIETGLRRSELLGLCVGNVRMARGIMRIEIADSKNGHARRIVLSAAAVAIMLHRIKDKAAMSRVFTVSEAALSRMWNKARADAGVTGFRWHDLRHEALSRMASKGLHVGELQAQSGHRTASVLLRYVNARAQDIADKLG